MVIGKNYPAHRIVYALAHGTDPGSMFIDHIDGNGRNNEPSNLRIATHTENMRNQCKYRNNTSGRKGVSWHKVARKWMAYIGIDGRVKYLGLFTSLDQASAAYESAARECFGEFHRQPTI